FPTRRSSDLILKGGYVEKERAAETRFEMFRSRRFLHHGRELMKVAEQQQAHAPKWLARPPSINTQCLIDRPHEIRPHHRHFVDDQELELPHNAAIATSADVVWPDQTRRKAEKGMDRLPTHIYCSEPGGRQHNALIGNDLTQTAQQRRFAGPSTTGDEKITFARCGKGCRQLVLFGDLTPIWPRKLAGLAKPRHRICLPTQATACASFRRSIFLRMLGSSQR